MKVVEFMGMPKAGKTTAIEVAESYLKFKDKKVRIIYEGARVSPLDKQDRFLYNSWSFHNTLNRVLEARLDHYDFILVDRGVYDHVAFTKAIEVFGNKKNCNIARDYYKTFGNLEDNILLYLLKPEDAVKREVKHNPFLGRVFKGDFLERLHSSYSEVYSEISKDREVKLFDGSNNLDSNTSDLILYFENLCKGDLK